jgi:hypothetical protein
MYVCAPAHISSALARVAIDILKRQPHYHGRSAVDQFRASRSDSQYADNATPPKREHHRLRAALLVLLIVIVFGSVLTSLMAMA